MLFWDGSLVKDFGNYKIIGETRDDAAGECFDKTARVLELGYPGGPAISREAEKWNNSKSKSYNLQVYHVESKSYSTGATTCNLNLPRPMLNSKDFDFSFSGLKTAVLYLVECLKKKKINLQKITPLLAYEIQEAIVDVLVEKTILAARKYKAKSVILAGGVSANKRLREKLENEVKKNLSNVVFLSPKTKYSTDNGAMIAISALFQQRYSKSKRGNWKTLKANANLRI